MEIKVRGTDNIQSSQDTYEIIQRIFYRRHKKVDHHKEHLWAIAMNLNLKVLNIELISIGTNNQTLASPQEIFRLPIYKHASKLVLVHNHPSGFLQPSESDLELTSKLIHAGLIFDIKVVDHVITTKHSYYSFMDNGLIKELSWNNKYALTFTRDKQFAEEMKKVKHEAKEHQKVARKEGEKAGEAKGMVKGAKAEKREIARQMLKEGEPVERVKRYTGLSASWVGRLKSEVEREAYQNKMD